MVGSLYLSRKSLTPPAMLYVYKSQIRPKIKYFCAESSLSRLDKIQKRLRGLVGDELAPTPCNPHTKRCWLLASLSLFPLRMFIQATFLNSASSDLHGQDPPCHVLRVDSASFVLHSIGNKEVSFKTASTSEFVTLWSWLPRGCFLDHYDLNLLDLIGYGQLLYILHIFIICTILPLFNPPSVTLYLEFLLGLSLDDQQYVIKQQQ